MIRRSVRDNVSVGTGFVAGPNATLWAPQSLVVGNYVYVGRNATVEVDGHIGDHTLIANNVGIVGRSDHDIRQVGQSIRFARGVREDPLHLSQAVHVGADCWIGFGAIVLSGVRIGDHSIIAAGSIVTHDIPSNSIAVGSPAMVKSHRFDDEQLTEHRRSLRSLGVRLSEEPDD